MIIEKNKIICNPKESPRLWFINNGKLCVAFKGKKETVKDSTIQKLGLVEESFKGGIENDKYL